MPDDRPVVILPEGVFSMSVCARDDVPRRNIEDVVNRLRPSGIDSPWAISDADEFADGTPHPAPCDQEADRTHYLLHC